MSTLDYVAARSEEYASTIHRMAESRHVGDHVEAEAALTAALVVLYHAGKALGWTDDELRLRVQSRLEITIQTAESDR